MINKTFLLPITSSIALYLTTEQAYSYIPQLVSRRPFFSVQKDHCSKTTCHVRPPSKVDKEDDPIPSLKSDPIPETETSSIPDLEYSADAHPIPSQPWRRGITDGCEDPIYSPWRLEAESLIYAAAESVGAKLRDITWGMGQLMVMVEDYEDVEGTIDGPEIVVDMGENYDEDLGPDLTWNPEMAEDEKREYIQTHPRAIVEILEDPTNDEKGRIDTTKLSAIAGAIEDILNEPEVEEKLRILSRHELILTQPSADMEPGVLESQKQFDGARSEEVAVHTRDPFKSNRTLNGTLVERNAMDVVINVRGRNVTIPNNFIYKVVLTSAELEEEDY